MPETGALARVRTENAALKLKLSALQAAHAALLTDHERLTSHLTTLQAQVKELAGALAAAQAACGALRWLCYLCQGSWLCPAA